MASNNGTLQPISNPPTFSTQNDGVLVFDGTNDFISTTTQYNSTQVSSFSVGIWFKTTETRGRKLIGFENTQTLGSGSYDRHLYVGSVDNVGSGGNLYFGVWTGSERLVISDQIVNDNYWYYAVGTYSSSTKKLRLYLDGVFLKETTADSAEAYNGWWRIAGTALGWTRSTTGTLNGRIGPVHAYGRALTDAEVLANYNANKSRFKTTNNPTVSGSFGGTAINLSISVIPESGLTASSYIIERATSTNGPWTRLGSTTSSSYSDTNIVASTTYYYRAKFIQSDNKNSDFGAVSSGVTTSTTPPPPPTGTIISTPTEINDFLRNPGIGVVNFLGFSWNSGAENAQPDPTVFYQRFYWSDFETANGVYNWNYFDNVINSSTPSTHTLIDWRIMPNCPTWLTNLGCPTFYLKGNTYGENTIPDHNSPIFLQYYERMLQAISNRYGDHPKFNMVEIGVGRWGEFHTWIPSPNEGNQYTWEEWNVARSYLPNETNAQKICDMYWTYFPNSIKCTIVGQIVEPRYSDGEYAIRRGAGWRADCWGDLNYHHPSVYTPAAAKPLTSQIWKTAPVSMETCGTMIDWPGWVVNSEADLDKILQDALDWHTSTVNLKNAPYIPSQFRTKVFEFLKKVGYRFVVKQVQHTASVVRGFQISISSTIENKGVAPAYHRWPIAYRLRNASTGEIAQRLISPYDIRTILPGTVTINDTFTVSGTVPAGAYKLDMTILNKEATDPFVNLAISGRRSDGWYEISNISVTNVANEGLMFATTFSGLNFDNSLSPTENSAVLVGTDTDTGFSFSASSPKLWGGARQASTGGYDRYGIEHELQLLDFHRFTASQLKAGRKYIITQLGDTNWTAVGAPANATVGTEFTATGSGSGTGIAAHSILPKNQTGSPSLWVREIRSNGAPPDSQNPNGKPCLRIYPTENSQSGRNSQASFIWYSGAKFENQSMYYVRLKMRFDPTWGQISTTNGYGTILTEFKANILDPQQQNSWDHIVALSLNYSPDFGPWNLGLSVAYGSSRNFSAPRSTYFWGPPPGTGKFQTPLVDTDPPQNWYFGIDDSYSADQVKTARFWSYGGMTKANAPRMTSGNNFSPTSSVDFGNWWTVEFAVRMQDSNGLVVGQNNSSDIGNKSRGWVWAATATSGSPNSLAANGSGVQRFFVPGVNLASPANYGLERLFPIGYYTGGTGGISDANKWIEWSSIEIWNRFPPDASPRTGTAAGIS